MTKFKFVFYTQKIEEEVNNRRSQINDIIRTAEEMMETAQPDEKAKLQSQVKEIKTSYDKIKKKCETRSRRLEEALKEVGFRTIWIQLLHISYTLIVA